MNVQRFNADDRIQKIKDFILEEANDKAKQIKEQAANTANIEKNNLLNAGKDKIIEHYKKELENYSVKKKIQQSYLNNQSRLQKMAARQEVVLRAKEEAKKALKQKLGNNEAQTSLIRKMVVQGLIKLMEKEVLIRCREKDTKMVEGLLDSASKEFSELIKKECGVEFVTKVQIDKYNVLSDSECEVGGVVLTAQNGSIVCNNTIDARLDLVYHESVPDLRKGLFPDLTRVIVREVKDTKEKHHE